VTSHRGDPPYADARRTAIDPDLASVAQWTEQAPSKRLVAGSIPAGGADTAPGTQLATSQRLVAGSIPAGGADTAPGTQLATSQRLVAGSIPAGGADTAPGTQLATSQRWVAGAIPAGGTDALTPGPASANPDISCFLRKTLADTPSIEKHFPTWSSDCRGRPTGLTSPQLRGLRGGHILRGSFFSRGLNLWQLLQLVLSLETAVNSACVHLASAHAARVPPPPVPDVRHRGGRPLTVVQHLVPQ
jgi:hypothetical protein